MLTGYVEGLISAWVLGLFGLHSILIEWVQPFVSNDLTKSHYLHKSFLRADNILAIQLGGYNS